MKCPLFIPELTLKTRNRMQDFSERWNCNTCPSSTVPPLHLCKPCKSPAHSKKNPMWSPCVQGNIWGWRFSKFLWVHTDIFKGRLSGTEQWNDLAPPEAPPGDMVRAGSYFPASLLCDNTFSFVIQWVTSPAAVLKIQGVKSDGDSNHLAHTGYRNTILVSACTNFPRLPWTKPLWHCLLTTHCALFIALLHSGWIECTN